jgi:hypothetical protein
MNCLPPARVAAAAQVIRDWIREAAARVDAAMAVVREWVEARRRLNDRILPYDH